MTDLTTTPDRFNLFFTLTKVDAANRIVAGRATQEVPDYAREVMDYASSRPNFEKWSAAAKNRTAGMPEGAASLGNIREMHAPVAAGKVTGITFNEAEKAVDIETYCADDGTWNKILKGVLTGFSVGGKYARRWPDPSNPTLIRYTADPAEISYVDSPAVPTAQYTFIKADGSQELRKVGASLLDMPEPPAPPPAPIDGMLINGAIVPTPDTLPVVASGQIVKDVAALPGTPAIPEGLIDPANAVTPINQPREEPVAKADESAPAWALELKAVFETTVSELDAIKVALNGTRTQALQKAKADGARVGIPLRGSEPPTPPMNGPTDANAYGDPANYAWFYADPANCAKAVASFNAGRDRSNYQDREWHILGRRIAAQASTVLTAKHQYEPLTKQISSKDGKMADTLSKVELAPLLAQITSALNVAADEIGKDPNAAKDMLMQLIGNLDGATATAPASTSDVNAAPTGSQAGAGEAALKDAGTPVASGTMPASEAPSTPSSTPTTPVTPSDDAMKAVTAQLSALTEMMGKFIGTITAPANDMAKATIPGDLAALLTPAQPTVDPVIAALTSGDKNALMKAAQLAGADGKPDVAAVLAKANEAARDTLTPIFTRMMFAKGYTNLELPVPVTNY